MSDIHRGVSLEFNMNSAYLRKYIHSTPFQSHHCQQQQPTPFWTKHKQYPHQPNSLHWHTSKAGRRTQSH